MTDFYGWIKFYYSTKQKTVTKQRDIFWSFFRCLTLVLRIVFCLLLHTFHFLGFLFQSLFVTFFLFGVVYLLRAVRQDIARLLLTSSHCSSKSMFPRTIKNVNTWYFHTKTSTPIDCLSTYFYRSLVCKTVCFGLYIDKTCVPDVFSESPLMSPWCPY